MAITIGKTDKFLTIQFSYKSDRINKIKSIENCRWDKVKKLWFIPLTRENYYKLKALFQNESIVVTFKQGDHNTNRISDLKNHLKLAGYSHKTQKAYLGHVTRFHSYIGKDLEAVNIDDVKRYILYLLEEQHVTHSYANIAISAIKYFCLNVLDRRIDVIKIPRPKKENKLPKVIGENTVIKILKALENEKHKTILFIVYSAGLRVGEVVRLRVENIDIQYYQR